MATDRSPEVIFEGRVIRIERERISLPNGHSATIEAVRHRGSVVMLATPAPDQVILIRQFRPVIQRWIWELPAGSLEPGEVPEAAAVRECEEEIGLTPRRVTLMGSWYPTPGFCDEIMHFYRCENLAPPRGHVARDEEEQIEPATVTLATAREMIADGGVMDMKTVVGVSLLERR